MSEVKVPELAQAKWTRIGKTIFWTHVSTAWGRSTITIAPEYVTIRVASVPGDLYLSERIFEGMLDSVPSLMVTTDDALVIPPSQFNSMKFPVYAVVLERSNAPAGQFEDASKRLLRMFLNDLPRDIRESI